MRPLRVLHVLGSMNRGGAETWLLHVLRRLNPNEVRMDFLVHTDQPAEFDREIRELGSQILYCPNPRNAISYATRFRQIISESGPYDVLHSHVHHHSGIVLILGYRAGIPVRIAHSHTDQSEVARRSGILRKAYLAGSRHLIGAYCTRGIAVSRNAARDLFGERWELDRRFEVLHCGIDLNPFAQQLDRDAARSAFGFYPEHLVFGHVGSFEPSKNHAFLTAIASEIAKREPRARFLLVGDGPLRRSIEHQIRQHGIADSVVFAGVRSDVPQILTAVMDRFLFPSAYEGLGLALIEAQAADLPSTVSDTIPEEATVVPKLVRRLSLHEHPEVWAQQALCHGERSGCGLAEIQRSSFEISASISGLMRVYRSAERPTEPAIQDRQTRLLS